MIHTRRGPRFPDLHEELGEDPAEYLDHDLTQPFENDGANSTPGDLLKARVRGIDSLQTLKAFVAVERALARESLTREEPRSHVMDLLWERNRELEANGERSDRVSESPRREIDARSCEVNWVDCEGGERSSTWSGGYAFGGPAASLGGEKA